jgi:hypothetical protein
LGGAGNNAFTPSDVFGTDDLGGFTLLSDSISHRSTVSDSHSASNSWANRSSDSGYNLSAMFSETSLQSTPSCGFSHQEVPSIGSSHQDAHSCDSCHGSYADDLGNAGKAADTWSDSGWGAIFETFGCAPCHMVMDEPSDEKAASGMTGYGGYQGLGIGNPGSYGGSGGANGDNEGGPDGAGGNPDTDGDTGMSR